MIRVGVILFQNRRYAPFLQAYEKLLREMKDVSYEVIFLNRDLSLNEKTEGNYISIPWKGKGTTSAPKYEKALNYLLFTPTAAGILRKKKYDFIIVLTTVPAVLLCNYLSRHYASRYIVDIRDYTQEGTASYFKREEKVLSWAALRIVSSADYARFLPKLEYTLFHNFNAADASERPVTRLVKAKDRPIVIANIGTLSYAKQIIKLIDLVDQDERFALHLYGNDGRGLITAHANEKNNARIRIMGAFQPRDKEALYAKSDLIFNCYGNDRPLVQYAISNRYYDGAIAHKPLVVSPETSMQRLSGEFACPLDLERLTDLNGLAEWYAELDAQAYDRYAEQVIRNAGETNAETIRKIQSCIRTSGK